MSRLNAVTDRTDFADVVQKAVAGEGYYIEFRPRASSSEEAWQPITEDHLFNQAENNYREGEAPEFRLEGRHVVTEDDERVPLKELKTLYRILKKAKRNGTELTLDKYDGGNPVPYPIYFDGGDYVEIGCKEFDWEAVEQYAKKLGLK